jgi:phage tail-like protein
LSSDLPAGEPLETGNFVLTISGDVIVNLTSVEGLTTRIGPADMNRASTRMRFGHRIWNRTKRDGEVTVTRTAPLDAEIDEIWKWFMDIRTNGRSTVKAGSSCKDGTISAYDRSGNLAARWELHAAWPSKIEALAVDPTTNDLPSEAVTFVYEQLERMVDPH